MNRDREVDLDRERRRQREESEFWDALFQAFLARPGDIIKWTDHDRALASEFGILLD